MKKIFKILGIILVIIIVGPIALGLTIKTLKSVPPPAGELYDVGGYKLHINCSAPLAELGQDRPTVIIETGAATVSPLYHWLQQAVSETTQVCLYDRAGLGRSEDSGLPRDSETIAKALHTLLDKAEIKRPFIFAGHSIAGLYMRQYVELYPQDVSAIAFLDSSHPNQTEALKLDNAKQLEEVAQQLSIARIFVNLGLAELYNPFLADPSLQAYPAEVQAQIEASVTAGKYLDASYAEMRDFDQAAKQAARNVDLGDRPVIVITAGEMAPIEALPVGTDPKEWGGIWLKLQQELAALSSNGRQITIDTASHMSLITDKDNAETAALHIQNLIEAVSSGKRPLE